MTIPFCEECSQTGDICYKCSNSSYKENNSCIPCTTYNAFCDTCNNQTCLSCQQGKKLTNQTCKDQCADSEQDYNNEDICLPCDQQFIFCDRCNDTECLQCKVGYFLSSQQCIQCQEVIQNCSECSKDGKECYKCESTELKRNNNSCQEKCTEMEQDYDQDGICQPCKEALQNCERCDINKSCKRCISDEYFINQNDFQCKLCSELIENCERCEENAQQCVKCAVGYVLFNGNCIKNCPNESFYVLNQICYKCEKSIQNCGQCSEDGQICSKCFEPYLVSLNQTCVDKCGEKEFDLNGTCHPCSIISNYEQCQTSDSQNTECQSCQQNYTLNNESQIEEFTNQSYQNSTQKQNTESLEYYDSLNDFNISIQEKQFIQSTNIISQIGIYSSFAGSTIVSVSSTASLSQFSSGQAQFFSAVLINQLILMNAFVDVNRTDNINAYYYMNFNGNDPISGINNNDFLSFDLDSKNLEVDKEIYILMNYESYTLIANLISAFFILVILYLIDFTLIILGRLKWKDKIEKVRRKLTNKKYVSMVYNLKSMQITNAVMLQLYHFSMSDWYTGLNSFLAVVILVSSFIQNIQLYFIFQSYQICIKYFNLKVEYDQTNEEKTKQELEEMKEKYVIYFECIKQNTKQQVIFQTLFLIRSFVLSFAAVVLVEFQILQITIYLIICSFWLFYLIFSRPFTSKLLFGQEILGEVVLIIIYSFNFYYKAKEDKTLAGDELKEAENLGKFLVFICCFYAIIALTISIILQIRDFYVSWKQSKLQKNKIHQETIKQSQQILDIGNESRLQIEQIVTTKVTQREENIFIDRTQDKISQGELSQPQFEPFQDRVQRKQKSEEMQID